MLRAESRIVAVLAVLLFGAMGLQAAGTDPLYTITLRDSAAADSPDALAAELAAAHGGSVEAVGEGSVTLRLAPTRVPVVAADPRVQVIAAQAVGSRGVAAASETMTWSTGVSYQYDDSGNVRQIGTDAFVYDHVNRLVQAQTNGVPRNYEYDRYGNRTGCVQSEGSVDESDCQFGYTIDGNTNRIVGLTYDAAGNLTSLGSHTYSYDALNMQTRDTWSSRAREYVYTADDERLAVYDGTNWRWTVRDTSGKVLRELTSSGLLGTANWAWSKDYVWRNGLLLASRQTESGSTLPVTYHYHLDHLGTPRRITDATDRIIGVHDDHPFGPEASGAQNEPSVSLMKYTGHERDLTGSSESWDTLDYMHARYASGTMGRFLSVDPARESVNLRLPQSWNRYTYALNNPVLYTDPDGRCAGVTALPCPGWLVSGGRAVATGAGARTAGAAAGPIGLAVANAGITGWQIGRAIGTSTIGDRTIDSRVTDLFVKGIELGISLSENTKHGDERAADPDRAVDRDKVKANGDVYIDTEEGTTVYVHGSDVVIENEAGELVTQWNDQTQQQTRTKEKDGKWRRVPKDQNEPEIQ